MYLESTIPLSLRNSLYLDSQTTTSDDETDDDFDFRKSASKVDLSVNGYFFFSKLIKI